MNLLKKAASGLSRRHFLKAAAAIVPAGISGSCKKPAPAPQEDSEEWIAAACWHNCGGRCVNKALVRNGRVVRQKTDDTHGDTADFPQQRSCLRGHAQHRQVFAPDRLKYPMKRTGWEPGTGGNKALRGKDSWVRISWEEALDHIAAEMKRIKDQCGNRSIYLDTWTEHNEYNRLFSYFGGYMHSWGTCSYGNWTLTPQNVGFGYAGGYDTCNDRLDLLNCEKVIFLGCNSAWTSLGNIPHFFHRARKKGTVFTGIDPYYNNTYAMLDAEWIPVRPATDTALLLAVAHVLITEDDPVNNPLIDWDFLSRCTIGFDAASMPEGEDKRKNFQDYVLGTYDKQPKTPAWASEICGVPTGKIKELAYDLRMQNRVALLASWAICRSHNTDNLPQLIMTIGAMTGHMGKPGHMTGACVHRTAANHGPWLVMPGRSGLPRYSNPVQDCANDTQTWDMILGKPYHYTGNGSHGMEWKPVEIRTADIHMIFHGSGNRVQSRQAMQKAIEAHRKVDFVVAAATFFTSNAQYADIVLPVNTEWEREGGLWWGNREILIVHQKIIDPLYESRDDQWIASEIGKRLDIEVYPFGRRQQFFNQIAGSKVISEIGAVGGYKTLCTITDEDIRDWKVEGTPQEGVIPLKELLRQGVYQVRRYPGDSYGFIAFKEFRENPEENPRPFSSSGKLEIYSQTLADKINRMGYSRIEPVPTYIPPVEGYEGTFRNWPAKIKGKYPYQLITVRYIKRTHSTMDNIKWLSEAFNNAVLVNSGDARKKNIFTGNTVMLTSRFGRILRTAQVTERVMPGCILLYHGSWPEYDENSGLDSGGAENILFGDLSTGQGTSGFNTLLVDIKKYSDEPLISDLEKPLKIIF